MCPAVCYLNITVLWVSLIVVSHSGTSDRTAYVSRMISLVDVCPCSALCLINMQASYKRLLPWSKVLLQKLTFTQLVKKTQCQILVLTQTHLVHALYTSVKIRFNIILSSTLMSPKWSLPFTFMHVSYELSNRIHR